MAEMSHADAHAEVSSQANTGEAQVVYELGFHIVPTVAEQQVGKVVEKIHALLGDAEIISEHFPTKISFAYQIERSVGSLRKKYNEGYFGFIKFATERGKIPALQAALTALPEALRFLLVKTTREDAAAQPRRAVFTSDRLEGEVLQKPAAPIEKHTEISEEELDKSLEALTH